MTIKLTSVGQCIFIAVALDVLLRILAEKQKYPQNCSVVFINQG